LLEYSDRIVKAGAIHCYSADTANRSDSTNVADHYDGESAVFNLHYLWWLG